MSRKNMREWFLVLFATKKYKEILSKDQKPELQQETESQNQEVPV